MTPGDHLRPAQGRGVQGGERADRARCPDRRPGAIYLPMIPETVISMLACARLGAPAHGRLRRVLLHRAVGPDHRLRRTGGHHRGRGYRRGAPAPLKPAVDEALLKCPDVRSVLVVRRTGQDVEWTDGRDQWWHDLVDRQSTEHTPEPFDAEHPLYVMYTSGTTGRAQGDPAHHRRLSDPGRLHALGGLRPQARRRRVLVRGRHRLGHRAQLHRLRAAGQPGDVGHVRGHARTPRTRPAGGG